MAQKKFNRFGLRRDLNLADLPDPRAAVNNLLNTPSLLGTEKSFTIDDLDPIIGIANTDITVSTFNGLRGITVEFTVIDENDEITEFTEIYRPLIKIKTQLDSAFFSTGEPFFYGGNGPNAFYYEDVDIIKDPEPLELNKRYDAGFVVLSGDHIYRSGLNANASVELTPENASGFGFEFLRRWNTGKDVFFNDDINPSSGDIETISDNFWERGQFLYSSKIKQSFQSLFGGVIWKSFFKSIATGTQQFRIDTSGLATVKFQDPDDQSFQIVRYGRSDASIITDLRAFVNNPDPTLPYSITNIQKILDIYDDQTKQLLQVEFAKTQNLKNGDRVYFDVTDGQLVSNNYVVLSPKDETVDEGKKTVIFWIDATELFNVLNVNVENDLINPDIGSSQNFVTNSITQAPPNYPATGYLATVRFIPYETRDLKTYLECVNHKNSLTSAEYVVINDTSFRCLDDFYYNQFMINDYIYDYRRYTSDTTAQGVRRYRITGLNDSTKTVSIGVDTNYSIAPDEINDQQAYLLDRGGDGGLTANTSILGEITLTGATVPGTITINGTSQNYSSVNVFTFASNQSNTISVNVNTSFRYTVRGSSGQTGPFGEAGGLGQILTGIIDLIGGATYTLISGGRGSTQQGQGGDGGSNLGDGGGYSAIFRGSNLTRDAVIIMAGGGGGGGGGGSSNGAAGNAGFTNGQNAIGPTSPTSPNTQATGGTQNSPGIGGISGSVGGANGSPGNEFAGGNGSTVTPFGGGGGGGWYGGGGGASSNSFTESGAGGSSKSNAVNSIVFEDSPQVDAIETEYANAALSQQLASGSTDILYHVSRLGDTTFRQKTITITQPVQEFVDYAFELRYFVKDEDVNSDPNAERYFGILRKLDSATNFTTFNFKFLYATDYNFSTIGDFKRFLDNKIPASGTSREIGIGQSALGRVQLSTAGDQYNSLYTLLPVESTYVPKVTWNDVVNTGSITTIANSTLIQLDATNIDAGEYLYDLNGLQDPTEAAPSAFEDRTRIVDKRVDVNTNRVTISKPALSSITTTYYSFDHRGFAGAWSATINPSARTIELENTGDPPTRNWEELRIGQVIVIDGITNSTYIRIANIQNLGTSPNLRTVITTDIDLVPLLGSATIQNKLVAVYQDKGVDISRPLDSYCIGVQCSQNNYDETVDKVATKYIALWAGSTTSIDLDSRWTETATYDTTTLGTSTFLRAKYKFPGNPAVNTSNSNTSISTDETGVWWWCDAYPGQVGEGFNNSRRYQSNHIYARIAGSNLEVSMIEAGFTNFPYNSFVPIGVIEGVVRNRGDVWNDATGTNDLRYYYIVRLLENYVDWNDADTLGGGARKLKSVNFQQFNSSDFNLDAYGLKSAYNSVRTRGIITSVLPSGFLIDNITRLRSLYTNSQSGNFEYTGRWFRVSSAITLDQANTTVSGLNNDLEMFLETTIDGGANTTTLASAFASFDADTNTTSYTMEAFTYIRIVDNGSGVYKFVWFPTFDAGSNNLTVYSLDRDDGNNVEFVPTGSNVPQKLLNLRPTLVNAIPDLPSNTTNETWKNGMYRYVQFRKDTLELVPIPSFINTRFPGIRLVNVNSNLDGSAPEAPKINLENATNKLSVYTFSQQIANRELCCPPLDTSPPFDSSPIGLATTINNPDMYIDGLVNVRSITANHPTDRIIAIPGNIANTQLPVDEKLEIVFGGVTYDLLIGSTTPIP